MTFQKGQVSFRKGIKLSEETKLKISLALQGKPSGNKGNKGQIPWNKNKPHSEETKKKISLSLKGKFSHNKNPVWKGGSPSYHRVIARKIAGTYGKTGFKKIKQDGQNFVVHHIDKNIKNNSPENLMIMTRSEHTKLHWQQGDIRTTI